MSSSAETPANPAAADDRTRLTAVIDIGATSIRLALAEYSSDGEVQIIEHLTRAVALGHDTFSSGAIRRETIEECVRILHTYRLKLNEYRIHDAEQVRVVATSAVREAANTLAFQDRVYLATGLVIQPFDEAELHRATYLGIQPFLAELPADDMLNLVYEVGGGSTEMLALRRENVQFAQTFRLGSLRLCVARAAYESGVVASRDVLESLIQQAVTRIQQSLGGREPARMLAMGGEIRLAAAEILRKPLTGRLAAVPLERLKKFTHQLLNQSIDRTARRFHVDLPTAELIAPALLVHCKLAENFAAATVHVAHVTLRDGLILDVVKRRVSSEMIHRQILDWAVKLGRKYHFDEPHARCVTDLAEQLFDQLGELHRLPPRYRTILTLAALLHEVGLFIGPRGYHKHSMYLIQNSEFFGIGGKDQQLVGLVARYHRRASPQPEHEGYALLDRNERVAVTKLASLLRIARSLDSSRSQLIHALRCRTLPNEVRLEVHSTADLSLELIELQKDAGLFTETFGLPVRLKQVEEAA